MPAIGGIAAVPNAVETRSTPERWWLVGLLVSGMTFCYAQRGTLSVAAPFMIRELQINTETMGLMLSAFSWCYCFMQVPSGWIVDRFGVRRAYACGFGLWSIACALTGAFRDIPAIMCFRVTMGVGQSVAFPASARTVANWFPDTERGLVNSSYLIGVRLGQALVNAAGVGLIALYGWRMFFVISGLAPLFWIFPWMMGLRRWEMPGRDRSRRRRARIALRSPRASGCCDIRRCSGPSLVSSHSTTSGSSSSIGCPAIFGWSVISRPTQMAFYGSVPFLVMSIVIVLSGLASDRLIATGFRELRVRKTFIAIGFAIALAIVPAGLVHDNGTSVWLLLTSLCGLGLTVPNYLEHYPGVLHEAAGRHGVGHPELWRQCGRHHRAVVDRRDRVSDRLVCCGLCPVRLHPRSWRAGLLVADERCRRFARRGLMLPSRLLLVRQNFPDLRLADIRTEARQQLEHSGFAARFQPGARIAIGVGSRGISNIDVIVQSAVQYWRDHGMTPFIFPSMGSHGAATPEGQADVLAHFGITEAVDGLPHRQSPRGRLAGQDGRGDRGLHGRRRARGRRRDDRRAREVAHEFRGPASRAAS